MRHSRSAFRVGAILSAALASVVLALPAAAHVSVPDDEVHSGSTSVIHFRVPHGCGELDTDTIEIQLPDGVVGAQPEYIPGWTVGVEMVKAEPYEQYGQTLTERVGVVRWSDGDLPYVAYYDFAVRATFLSDPGTVLAFPTVQKCGTEEVAWIEPTVEGQDEPEHPAPTVTVIEAAAEAHDH